MRLARALPLLALGALGTGCGGPAGTFEPGVEHVPGPGYFVIRVVPAEAIDTRRITLARDGDDGGKAILFTSHRGDERYLSGVDLPSTLRAQVDGIGCVGSIQLVSDMEHDGTLTIEGAACELRLDRVHRPETVDHQLVDDGPLAS